MKQFIAFFLLFISLEGCNTSSNSSSPIQGINTTINISDNRVIAFRKFLKLFKRLPLPYKVSTHDNNDTIHYQKVDTTFIKDGCNCGICIGELSDTTNFFYLLYDIPTDIGALGLAIFNKNAIEVANKLLTIGDLNSSCGSDYFSETLIIEKDYSINIIDSLSISKCDEKENELPGTTKNTIELMTGKITPVGKIDLSVIQKKNVSSKFPNQL